MLTKINTTLGILVMIGALACAGLWGYYHFNEIKTSAIVQTLEG